MGRLELERQTNARVENDPLRARGSEMAMRRYPSPATVNFDYTIVGLTTK